MSNLDFVNFVFWPGVGGVVLFFLCRPILHWYWRINEIASDLRAIREALVPASLVVAAQSEAPQSLESMAEDGDVEAQFQLGKQFDDQANEIQAFKWFKKAADQGHATAQFNVGDMYIDGEGVDRNLAEGRHWLTLAAGQGLQKAKKRLAFLEIG